MDRQNLLIFDKLPSALERYIGEYGYHFTAKLAKAAIKNMRKKDASGKMVPIEPWSKEELEAILKRANISIDNNVMDDMVYVGNMIKADNWKGSCQTEQQLAQCIKETLDDPDQRIGHVFVGWCAKTLFNGIPYDWAEMI